MGLAGCSSDSGDEPTADCAVRGRVVLPGVASDISGFVVTLAGRASAVAATDGVGAFSFEHLRPGRYAVSVRVPSTLEGTKTTFVELTDGASTVPDMVFAPLGEVSGTVTLGSATGNAGITVIAGPTAAGTTDDRGVYVLHDVPIGVVDVVAAHAGWQSASTKGIAVEYRKRTSAPEMTLVRAAVGSGVLQGAVSIAGETSHEGVTILATGTAGTAATITDATGIWSLGGLSSGAYSVTVSAPSTVEAVRSVKVTVDGDKPAIVEPMSFTPLGTLHGRVTLGGRATGNAGVMVWVPDAPAAATNDAGEWEIKGVRVGVSTIRASMDGWSVGSVAGPSLHWRETAKADPIDLAPDPSFVTTITGVAKIVGHTDHSGSVVSLSGSPFTTTTALDGSYVLKVLGTGVRTLTFQSKDGRYNGDLGNVLLMPGGSASVLSGSTVAPIPTVRLVRGTRIGRGAPLGVNPSGEIIALVLEKTGGAHIDRLTTSGSATKLIEGAFNGSNWFLLSPDRRWLAYRTASASGFSVASTTDGSVLSFAATVERLPLFTTDGKWLGYTSGGGFYLRSLETGVTRKLFDSPEGGGNCTLSPTVEWAACAYDDKLKIVSTSGTGTPISVPSGYMWSAMGAQWLSDNRMVHVLPSGGVGLATPWASTPDQVLIPSGASQIEVSPDRRSVLVWVWQSDGTRLYLIPPGSTTPTQIASMPSSAPSLAAFSKDSSRVAAVSYSPTAGTQMWIGSVSSPSTGAVASPVSDSGKLQFLGNAAVVGVSGYYSSLQIVPLSSMTPKSLAGSVADPVVASPDGKTLAFAERGTSQWLKTTNAFGLVTDLSADNASAIGTWTSDSARFSARFGTTAESWWSVADPTGATPVVPVSWQWSFEWLSPSHAIVSDSRPSTYGVGYPADDSIWLASFP